MMRHVLTAQLLLVMLGFLVAGSVHAYFTDAEPLPTSEFQLGTVDIEVYKAADGDSEFVTPEHTSGKATWSVINTGSKAIKLRAKIIEEYVNEPEYNDETAWGVGSSVNKNTPDDAISPRFGGGNARYHVYTLGATEENPLELKLGYGANYTDAGSVTIWNDKNHLYVEATTMDWILMETHLYAESSIPTNSAPGQLGNKLEPMSTSVSYQLPMPSGIKGKKVYIALHAAIGQSISGGDDVEPEINITVQGWTEGGDGYYYYCDPVPEDGTIEFEVTFEIVGSWSGEYKIYLDEVQAVQASNNAIDTVWPLHPCNEGK